MARRVTTCGEVLGPSCHCDVLLSSSVVPFCAFVRLMCSSVKASIGKDPGLEGKVGFQANSLRL